MPCFLDDQELALPDATSPDSATLGNLLQHARAQSEQLGRVIVEVRIDGDALGQDALDERMDQPVGDADVRLYSVDPAELGVQALGEARTQLAALGDLQQEAADLLQADQAGEAFAKLGGAVQGWINVASAVTQSAHLNGINLDDVEAGDDSALAIVNALAQQLQEFKTLIEAGDTTALADALGYEWPDVVSRWDDLLQALANRLSVA